MTMAGPRRGFLGGLDSRSRDELMGLSRIRFYQGVGEDRNRIERQAILPAGALSGRTLRSVPVEFLSDEQAAAYGRFAGEPSRAELERFFFLSDADRERTDKRRGDHNRIGFAVQLGTVRFPGTFLSDPLDVPWPVVEYLAAQLGVADASVAKRYAERLPTQDKHAREIRQAYGYRDLSAPDAAAGLQEFMEGRAWTHAEPGLRGCGYVVSGWAAGR